MDGMTIEERIQAKVDEKKRKRALIECLDSRNLESRLTTAQLETILAKHKRAKYIYILGGNQSGKSSVAVRDLVWLAENTHPHFDRPNGTECGGCKSKDIFYEKESGEKTYFCNNCDNLWKDWGDEPLGILLCGEDRKNVEENLWKPRIFPLLTEPEKWKPLKYGATLYGYQHSETKNKILFFYHGAGEEKTRKSAQGYTVHFVYLDELPGYKVIEELQRRVDARFGYFVASFTMKTVNKRVVRFMNGQEKAGSAQIFKLSKLDNPVYASKGVREHILAQLEGLTEVEKNRILYGDIGDDENKVFHYSEKVLCGKLPTTYSRGWRHAAIIDPAESVKAGFGLFAEDPHTKSWHAVKIKYIKDIKDPIWLLEQYLKECEGFSIAVYGSDDQHYFIKLAKNHFGIKLKWPKTKRKNKKYGGGKEALIDNLQIFMNSGRLKIDPDKFSEFWEELDEYEYKEDESGQIKNSSRFHILDVVMYFVDMLPAKVKENLPGLTWAEEIEIYNEKLRRQGAKREPKSKQAKYIMKSIKGMQRYNKKRGRKLWK